MSTNRLQHTVRELAVEIPGATRYFERIGLDYCCGGHRLLDEACAEKGIDAASVVARLDELTSAGAPREFETDYASMPLGDLADHIVEAHHVPTREELARIFVLFDKVCDAHGARRPELLEMRTVFRALAEDLIPHMAKEEQVLFPYVRQLEAAALGRGTLPVAFFGTVQNPIRMMMGEHEAAGELLASLRRLGADYVPPEDACMTYRTLLQALAELERDTHVHIHKENNILFPRAVELEQTR